LAGRLMTGLRLPLAHDLEKETQTHPMTGSEI